MGELEASKREVKEREKDISSLRERNRRLEADKERLEDEVHVLDIRMIVLKLLLVIH